ncbi:MAG: hypothetical protein C4542_06250 [Dehalococcoidia bacterium]|nr:MAG: hypothetical protein C4542_06250 [Dehalococcoidia bacterium]
METLKKTTMLLLIVPVILSMLLVVGCGNKAAFAPLPYLPPKYYACTQVDPQALVNAYYVGNVDITSVRARYDGVIFVFKDVLVNNRTFIGMNEGFILVDQIRCYLTNPENMNGFKSGDKIDVVGRNAGQTSYFIPGLTFKDCFVLPAGQIALPATPGAVPGTFGPAY